MNIRSHPQNIARFYIARDVSLSSPFSDRARSPLILFDSQKQISSSPDPFLTAKIGSRPLRIIFDSKIGSLPSRIIFNGLKRISSSHNDSDIQDRISFFNNSFTRFSGYQPDTFLSFSATKIQINRILHPGPGKLLHSPILVYITQTIFKYVFNEPRSTSKNQFT